MAETKLSNLEKKKKELESELARIQDGLDKSIDEVKEGVTDSMDPKNIIKKYPIPIVGASLVVGFLLGRNRKETSTLASKSYQGGESPIARELKRIVAKRGLSLLLDFLDDKVAALKQNDQASGD
jgi:hypothetical protein